MNQNIIEKFNDLLGEEKVKVDEPMKRHTTFRIGGPADYFLLPSSEEELSGILKICKNEELPYFILGNGSNLLVSDEGYRGVIIQLYRNYGDITVKGNEIHATAGALLSQIAVAAKNASLTGFEFAGGIPGTLGGAVVMNARCAERSNCYDSCRRNSRTSGREAGNGISHKSCENKRISGVERSDRS